MASQSQLRQIAAAKKKREEARKLELAQKVQVNPNTNASKTRRNLKQGLTISGITQNIANTAAQREANKPKTSQDIAQQAKDKIQAARQRHLGDTQGAEGTTGLTTKQKAELATTGQITPRTITNGKITQDAQSAIEQNTNELGIIPNRGDFYNEETGVFNQNAYISSLEQFGANKVKTEQENREFAQTESQLELQADDLKTDAQIRKETEENELAQLINEQFEARKDEKRKSTDKQVALQEEEIQKARDSLSSQIGAAKQGGRSQAFIAGLQASSQEDIRAMQDNIKDIVDSGAATIDDLQAQADIQKATDVQNAISAYKAEQESRVSIQRETGLNQLNSLIEAGALTEASDATLFSLTSQAGLDYGTTLALRAIETQKEATIPESSVNDIAAKIQDGTATLKEANEFQKYLDLVQASNDAKNKLEQGDFVQFKAADGNSYILNKNTGETQIQAQAAEELEEEKGKFKVAQDAQGNDVLYNDTTGDTKAIQSTGNLITSNFAGRAVTLDEGAMEGFASASQALSNATGEELRVGAVASSSTRNQADTIRTMAAEHGVTFDENNPNAAAEQLRAQGHLVANVGHSQHEHGNAVDIFPDQAYIEKVKPFLEAAGWEQSKSPNDKGHFNYVGGEKVDSATERTADAFLKSFNMGEFDQETAITKIGSSKDNIPVRNRFVEKVAEQGGKRVFGQDSDTIAAIEQQIGNLNKLKENDLYSYISGKAQGGFLGTGVGRQVFTPKYGDALTLISNVISSETLNALAGAKARGITFGALSEGELNIVQQSANNLASRTKRDAQGNITGFHGTEDAMLGDINNLIKFLKKSVTNKGTAGTPIPSNAEILQQAQPTQSGNWDSTDDDFLNSL